MVTATTTRNGSPEASAPDASAPDAACASVSEWVYDAGGRLMRETTPAGSRTYEYDVAGQLLAVTDPDGSRTEYVHDGLGRRTRLIGPGGSWTEYAWGPTGYLNGTTDRTPEGMELSRHELWVDALGELAAVDGAELWWDTASPVPTLTGIGGGQVLSLPGGVTGIGDAWTAPGWRAARPTDHTDPWAVLGTPTVPDPAPGGTAGAGTSGFGSVTGLSGAMPAGITLTGNGGLDVAGLEWLGARAYDPAARGFLSTDPLAPVLGAGWDGNPYAYAGNNPLNTTDPTGLRPLTDDELKAYDGSSRGGLAAAGDWLGDNWEYVAGGAMVIAGGVLMATGVGGPAGMMLIGAGADTIIQKATTGKVNWGQVALSGALGGFGGASIAARAGLTGMKAALVAGASSGGISGGIQGTYGYYTGAGPHTITGALGATAQGTVFGAATGGVGGAAGQKISQRLMGAVTARPDAGTMAMGRVMQYRVSPYADLHGMGYYKALPPKVYSFTETYLPSRHDSIHLWANKKWIDYQMMQGKSLVDIGAPAEALRPAGVPALGPSPYYNMELEQVAGYPGYSQDPQPSWNLG
jgi:RHS repeat-associated protein